MKFKCNCCKLYKDKKYKYQKNCQECQIKNRKRNNRNSYIKWISKKFNIEKNKRRYSEWIKLNPDKAKKIQIRYRRKKGQVPRKEYKPLSGEKHPFYTGNAGRTNNEKWKKITLNIWKRDIFTCQLCGTRVGPYGAKPITHHIIPYDISKDNNINNLITLCNSCHLKIHWRIKKEGDYIFV